MSAAPSNAIDPPVSKLTSHEQEGEIDIIPDPSDDSTQPDVIVSNSFYDEEEAMANGDLSSMAIEMPILGNETIETEAWDDRELIDAWEVAREEFELHNPGPGSWLDKQTAVLAIGKPLTGAKESSGASKWYTSASKRSRSDRADANNSKSGHRNTTQPSAEASSSTYAYTPARTVHAPEEEHGRLDTTTNTMESLMGISNEGSTKAGKQQKRRRESGGPAQAQAEVQAGNAGDGGDRMDWEDDGGPPKRSRVAFATPVATSEPSHSPPGAHRAISPAYQPPSPSSYGQAPEPGAAHGPQVPSGIAAGRLSMARGKNGLNGQAQTNGRGKGKGKNKAGNPYANGSNGINPYAFSNPTLGGQTVPTPGPNNPAPSPLFPASEPFTSATSPPTGYQPNASGVYPEMGGQPVTRAFSSGSSMTREEASVRAVNAQWWAGYWHAMTEVLPSEMECRAQGH